MSPELEPQRENELVQYARMRTFLTDVLVTAMEDGVLEDHTAIHLQTIGSNILKLERKED